MLCVLLGSLHPSVVALPTRGARLQREIASIGLAPPMAAPEGEPEPARSTKSFSYPLGEDVFSARPWSSTKDTHDRDYTTRAPLRQTLLVAAEHRGARRVGHGWGAAPELWDE
jgi:hypothetical protein